jgi:hypothetical protein
MYDCFDICLCAKCKRIKNNCAECKYNLEKIKECTEKGIKECKYFRRSDLIE